MTPVRKELLRKSRSLMSRAARSVEEANLALVRAKEIHAHLSAGGPASKCLRPVVPDHAALRDNSAHVNLLLDLDSEAELQ